MTKYEIVFTVNGGLEVVGEITEGFTERNIEVAFPSGQIVGAYTPIVVKCDAPNRETYDWMYECLRNRDNIGSLCSGIRENHNLKSCPICKGEVELNETNIVGTVSYNFICKKCKMQFSKNSWREEYSKSMVIDKSKIIEEWNEGGMNE